MGKLILAINAGSSSVKVSVYEGSSSDKDDTPKMLADISIAGLTAPPAELTYTRGEQKIKGKKVDDVDSQESAFDYVLRYLMNDDGLPQLKQKEDIEFACHRIVHGGDFDHATKIDKDTYHKLEELSDLAPLHNAGALTIVKAVHAQLPSAKNIAFFDSTYHASIPPHIRTYPISPSVATHNALRKYGFHGLSYAFIARSVAASLSKPLSSLNIIALHLGSGCSAACIQAGKSLDTSMGLTPLAGLPGATRSGSIDPSLIFHFTHSAGKLSQESTKGMHITQAEQILNKESGWKALTGTTDFGTISSKAEAGDADCRLAFDLVVDRILGFVGSYYVKLEGKCDALVFAGGIGEKGSLLRKRIVEKVKCLGFVVDEGRNEKPGEGIVEDISGEGARHKVLIVQTDEQAEMARQCAAQAEKFRESA